MASNPLDQYRSNANETTLMTSRKVFLGVTFVTTKILDKRFRICTSINESELNELPKAYNKNYIRVNTDAEIEYEILRKNSFIDLETTNAINVLPEQIKISLL